MTLREGSAVGPYEIRARIGVGGMAAFEGANGARIVAAVLERTPPALSELRDDVPPALDRVLLDPLRADPRFADLLRCVRLSDVSPVGGPVRAHPAS